MIHPSTDPPVLSYVPPSPDVMKTSIVSFFCRGEIVRYPQHQREDDDVCVHKRLKRALITRSEARDEANPVTLRDDGSASRRRGCRRGLRDALTLASGGRLDEPTRRSWRHPRARQEAAPFWATRSTSQIHWSERVDSGYALVPKPSLSNPPCVRSPHGRLCTAPLLARENRHSAPGRRIRGGTIPHALVGPSPRHGLPLGSGNTVDRTPVPWPLSAANGCR